MEYISRDECNAGKRCFRGFIVYHSFLLWMGCGDRYGVKCQLLALKWLLSEGIPAKKKKRKVCGKEWSQEES